MMYVRHEFFWFKVLPFGIVSAKIASTSIILVCPESEASPFLFYVIRFLVRWHLTICYFKIVYQNCVRPGAP